ncbi:MAG: KilA-N domain-containing protein [Erysipelotrichales bacterium]|nr:KilA-N domain-containing protein [Erysipelotrichales bacterium]
MANKKGNSKTEINGLEVTFSTRGKEIYISLTDIAKLKNVDDPSDVIKKWMTNKDSFDFYSLWEELSNPDFNSAEFCRIKIEELGYNAFVMTPTKWKKLTNAIGIIPSAGKYSEGTFAHPDIALEFASWIDSRFKLYLIKEFQRLKGEEQKQLEWSAKRELAKINYVIHTDAIKENLIFPLLTKDQINHVYANEADMLNVALFGNTASNWSRNNPDKKGNMRDYASIEQLLVLANIESYNAILIEQGLPQAQRIVLLHETAKKQLETLTLSITNKKKITKQIT